MPCGKVRLSCPTGVRYADRGIHRRSHLQTGVRYADPGLWTFPAATPPAVRKGSAFPGDPLLLFLAATPPLSATRTTQSKTPLWFGRGTSGSGSAAAAGRTPALY